MSQKRLSQPDPGPVRRRAPSSSPGIRSRAEGDMRTSRDRGPSYCGGLGLAVEWPEDQADAEPKGDHLAGADTRAARLSGLVRWTNSSID
jgi:hypothetical protein